MDPKFTDPVVVASGLALLGVIIYYERDRIKWLRESREILDRFFETREKQQKNKSGKKEVDL